MKLVHAADLHLDHPFSLSAPSEAGKRRQEIRALFSSLIDHAKDFGAELFLIPGDLFDDQYVTKETVELVCEKIASFPECRFVISPANHDPYNENSPYFQTSFPDNAYIFQNEALEFFDFPELDARVYGFSYHSKKMPSGLFDGFALQKQMSTNILLAHGYINYSGNPSNLFGTDFIENSGFDYIALGHLHNHDGIKKAGKTLYAYSGCLEGTGFDEVGRKGFIEGEISEKGTKLDFVGFSNRIFEKCSVDLSGVSDEERKKELVKNKTDEYQSDISLRLRLCGMPYAKLDLSQEAIRSLISRFDYLEIKNETLPFFDAEKTKDDKTVLGVFYRKLLPKLESCDEDEKRIAHLALQYGMSALCGNDIGDADDE